MHIFDGMSNGWRILASALVVSAAVLSIGGSAARLPGWPVRSEGHDRAGQPNLPEPPDRPAVEPGGPADPPVAVASAWQACAYEQGVYRDERVRLQWTVVAPEARARVRRTEIVHGERERTPREDVARADRTLVSWALAPATAVAPAATGDRAGREVEVHHCVLRGRPDAKLAFLRDAEHLLFKVAADLPRDEWATLAFRVHTSAGRELMLGPARVRIAAFGRPSCRFDLCELFTEPGERVTSVRVAIADFGDPLP